jgi:hypothetical protein
VKLNDRVSFPSLLQMDSYMLEPPVVPPPDETADPLPNLAVDPTVLDLTRPMPMSSPAPASSSQPTPAPAVGSILGTPILGTDTLQSLVQAAAAVSTSTPPSLHSSDSTVIMSPQQQTQPARPSQAPLVVDGEGVVLYELFAILVHSGNAAIGHYFVRKRRAKGGKRREEKRREEKRREEKRREEKREEERLR